MGGGGWVGEAGRLVVIRQDEPPPLKAGTVKTYVLYRRPDRGSIPSSLCGGRGFYHSSGGSAWHTGGV